MDKKLFLTILESKLNSGTRFGPELLEHVREETISVTEYLAGFDENTTAGKVTPPEKKK